MTTKRRWTGGEGAGSPTFTASERARVILQMQQHIGRLHRTSLDVLGETTGIPGRTLRAILSAADGVDFILVMPSNGIVYVAEYADEGARTTRQLRSRARKLTDRANRRDQMAAQMERLQGLMFDEDDFEEPDDDL